jgi:BirA family biotin operon repressor/biotin-[acetyl-CoA-carboxylase] ligase
LGVSIDLRSIADLDVNIRLVHSSEIHSTNRYILDQIPLGAREGLVVVADYQSAGRGRLDRSWQAPPGASLLVSVLVDLTPLGEWMSLASLVVGVSMVDAIEMLAPGRVTLKWPNDLMLDGKKLGGILVEVSPFVSGTMAVCGSGINVSWTLEDLDRIGRPAASLMHPESASGSERTLILEHYLPRLFSNIRALAGGAPAREAFRDRYRAQCSTLGCDVRIDLRSGEIVGRAVDIEDDGALKVVTDEGIVTIRTGDVVHARPVVANEQEG